MALAFWFWLLYAIWVLSGFFGIPTFTDANGRNYYYGRHFVIAVLFALIGWAVFGNAFHTLVH
jgi:hypothetical protein